LPLFSGGGEHEEAMGKQFTFLRGLAILFVLVNHSITMSLWMAERSGLSAPGRVLYDLMVVLKQFGLITVPIFLFLSGAFFAFGIANRSNKGTVRIVWQNILGALWPYLLWTCFFNLMVLFLLKESITPLQFIKNILVGYPFNFVPLLLFFYVLGPLLVWGMKRSPAISILVILLYQVFLLLEENTGYFGIFLPEWAHYFALPVVRDPLSKWAIYFPFGVFYQLNSRSFSGQSRKFAVPIAFLLIAIAVLGDLHELHIIVFPLANILMPFFFILLIPLVTRRASPVFLWVEAIGKRSYGFYLTNLIALTLTLLGLKVIFPWLLEQYVVLVPLLFIIALYVPWGLMKLLEMSPKRVVYHYVFG
jgi:peptidoglycan/LPS O-acetylase OafA/YrhL